MVMSKFVLVFVLQLLQLRHAEFASEGLKELDHNGENLPWIDYLSEKTRITLYKSTTGEINDESKVLEKTQNNKFISPLDIVPRPENERLLNVGVPFKTNMISVPLSIPAISESISNELLQSSTSDLESTTTTEFLQSSTSDLETTTITESLQSSTSDLETTTTTESLQSSTSDLETTTTTESLQSSTSDLESTTTMESLQSSTPDSESLQNSTPDSESLQNSTPDSESLESSTPDSESLQNSTPDSDSVQNSTPDSESLENSTPDTDSVQTSTPDSDSLQNSTPDSDSLQNSTPDSESTTTTESPQTSKPDSDKSDKNTFWNPWLISLVSLGAFMAFSIIVISAYHIGKIRTRDKNGYPPYETEPERIIPRVRGFRNPFPSVKDLGT